MVEGWRWPRGGEPTLAAAGGGAPFLLCGWRPARAGVPGRPKAVRARGRPPPALARRLGLRRPPRAAGWAPGSSGRGRPPTSPSVLEASEAPTALPRPARARVGRTDRQAPRWPRPVLATGINRSSPYTVTGAGQPGGRAAGCAARRNSRPQSDESNTVTARAACAGTRPARALRSHSRGWRRGQLPGHGWEVGSARPGPPGRGTAGARPAVGGQGRLRGPEASPLPAAAGGSARPGPGRCSGPRPRAAGRRGGQASLAPPSASRSGSCFPGPSSPRQPPCRRRSWQRRTPFPGAGGVHTRLPGHQGERSWRPGHRAGAPARLYPRCRNPSRVTSAPSPASPRPPPRSNCASPALPAPARCPSPLLPPASS